MVLSINTNVGSQVALASLNKTTRQLEQATLRVSTGFKVNGAKDDPSTFAIAQRLRADVAGFGSVTTRLAEGVAIADTAIAAAESISDLLIDLKAKAVSANQSGLTSATHFALNTDFQALITQIGSVTNTASFNGVNLVGATTAFNVLSNIDGTTINFNPGGLDATVLGLDTADLNDQAGAAAALGAVDAAIDQVNAELASVGSFANSLVIQKDFIAALTDSLVAGIGNLVDADLARESARLQSLQIKQQLGVQALAIANAAPQTILGLFQ